MTINKTQEDGKITFVLDGKLDTTEAPRLQEVLIPAFDEAQHIELDLSKVAYVSSAGLRVLILAQKTAKEKGASMTLKGVSDEIMKIFKMTGYDTVLTII
jgi:anti-anti-sigma factor